MRDHDLRSSVGVRFGLSLLVVLVLAVAGCGDRESASTTASSLPWWTLPIGPDSSLCTRSVGDRCLDTLYFDVDEWKDRNDQAQLAEQARDLFDLLELLDGASSEMDIDPVEYVRDAVARLGDPDFTPTPGQARNVVDVARAIGKLDRPQGVEQTSWSRTIQSVDGLLTRFLAYLR